MARKQAAGAWGCPWRQRRVPGGRNGGTALIQSELPFRWRRKTGKVKKFDPGAKGRWTEGSGEGQSQGQDSEPESSFDYSWATETQGSLESGAESELEAEISEMRMEFLEDFFKFCRQQDFANKSLSQLAVLWMLVIFRTPGGFGAFAEKTLKNAASSQGTGESWRDVLPLPVPKQVQETVSKILVEQGFTFKKTGMTGNQVQGEYRRVGIDCLVFGLITSLNYMWGGLRENSRVHGGPWRAHHISAVDHLTECATYVIDSRDGVVGKGVPRTPQGSWENRVKDARISYHGELVMKAEELDYERVLPSLPPEGFGGVVDILEVCEGEVKRLLEDPGLCVLPESELPQLIPRPRVRVKQGDWEKLAKALYERGILVPTSEIISLRGEPVKNGLFGVEKGNKFLEDGRTSQRLIMDLRGSNAIMKIIEGDIKTLSGASAFTSVVLEDNKVITLSGDDLVSSFYLFKLPPKWHPFLAFEKEVSWRSLGVDREGSTYLASSVLPMGFCSSVGIMQHIHRRLALWQPREGAGLAKALELRKDRPWPSLGEACPVWALYLDDSTILREVEVKVAASLQGRPQKEQERMRLAYQFWGIPYNAKKAIEEAEVAERLGAFLDGGRGRVGVTVQRLLDNMSLGLWLLQQGQISRKALQVFMGKEVHTLQFRRPLFSTYDHLWKLITGPSDFPWLDEKAISEICTALSLMPLRFTDWRARLDPYVMASDASERGGGFVMARRLTDKGVEALRKAESGENQFRSGVLVIDMFAGIGGLLRSLERQGLKWEHHVVIESDKGCRRCIRRTWPGGSEYTDITKMTKEDFVRELNKVDNLTLVIAGGGSPCQGLSKLSSERSHFRDERSGLFFTMADHLDTISNLCKEREVKFLGLLENVVMDEEDRNDISFRLGWKPNLAESGEVSSVRRPRLYWLNRDVPQTPWLTVDSQEVVSKITLSGPVEPDELWMPEGYTWRNPDRRRRFPTFTRPIRRWQPPPDPAGLKGCPKVAQDRWKRDDYRFPPYTYRDENLLQDAEGNRQKVPAESRELLMGFKRHHTLKLDRVLFKDSHWHQSEDIRQAALGNSFHTTTVALILGAVLEKMGFLKVSLSPDQLVNQLVVEDYEENYPTASEKGDASEDDTVQPSERANEDDLLNQLTVNQLDLDEAELHKNLMTRMVHVFLRQVEMRGSDIRLDTGDLFRADAYPRCAIDPLKWEWRHCRAFRWKRVEHINLLELRAALHAIQWRCRRAAYCDFRTMILIDNQAILAVMAKGRSSSKKVNNLLRRLAALCCSLNIYVLVCWVDTVDNPADEASRLFDDDR